jgi:hypothetical protein
MDIGLVVQRWHCMTVRYNPVYGGISTINDTPETGYKYPGNGVVLSQGV